MMLLTCPWCGHRTVQEFRYVGEQGAIRPAGADVTPAAWRTYLYRRANPAGWTTETWYHRAGCKRYFVAERHTVTDEVRATRAPTVPGGAR